MLQDMIRTPEQLSIDECISSPIANQIFNFQYDGDLFETTITSPKVSSSTPNTIVPTSAVTATATDYDPSFTSNFSPFDSSSDIISVLLNPQPPPEPDILLPMDPAFATEHSTNQLNQMISTSAAFTSYSPDSVVSQMPLALSGYLGSFIDANGGIGGEVYADGMGVTACGAEGDLGLFAGAGIYTPVSMQRVYSPGDMQVLGDSQHLMARCSSSPAPLQVASDISTLDDSTYKVGRLSVEERKEKIHRYLKKRNERNFSKKIKYACRKTLADSRPRVRGRFAKNDEFGEVAPRPNSANHEYDDDEEIVVKDEEDMLQSSDILAHISGVNSFKYNYTVESWI